MYKVVVTSGGRTTVTLARTRGDVLRMVREDHRAAIVIENEAGRFYDPIEFAALYERRPHA
jgi:hypothetical protein